MTEFNWTMQDHEPMKLRTLLMQHGVTRTLLKAIKFHGGKIIVNNKARYANFILKKDDKVKLVLPPEPSNDYVRASYNKIEIVYEDEHFLVINKPAGLASVPSRIYSEDSLVNRVKGYYLQQNYSNQKVHIVTRLDKDTSGLVLFAKHHLAHSVLDKQLKDHRLSKMYMALASGRIGYNHCQINLPIGRLKDSFVKRTVRDDGKMSKTEFWTIKRHKDVTLVRVKLLTGRTHQIRVHFDYIGHPLLGDWLYNPKDKRLNRQALHCYELRFHNPFDNKIVVCHADLPSDISNLI
ncbi:RluA family pseudouridine synthase [Apilactobacillus sp. TMW 2.2459]|uniref:RluA family pseudouridine synthase n=1 Tax=Apilactobacillus xinyiensis TaxID=2841032 RepID=UPI00200F2EBE|nr:RluA family pseudouridine synthase [Apilactobacillus xinyiensis]MCL0312429.1 RluA family pseudouridine synthase [Apilactobacillus xinyiensis]